MEIVVMVVVGLVGLAVLLAVKWLGNRIAGRTRAIGSRRSQARRHFVKAAQLLESSRSPGKRKLAWNAISEADMAIELDPTDAALYIVKSIALEQLGRPADALRALSVALTTPAVRTLSTSERAEALAKRAGEILCCFAEGMFMFLPSCKLCGRRISLFCSSGNVTENQPTEWFAHISSHGWWQLVTNMSYTQKFEILAQLLSQIRCILD